MSNWKHATVKNTRLKIDGKEIPETEFSQYEALTDELLQSAVPPVPPVAPVPPVPGETPPTPTTAPTPPGPSRVSTDTDDQGNTVIRVERGGKPMEIKVKDGEVWVDGKKVEEGESLDLPADGQYWFWNGHPGNMLGIDGNRLFLGAPKGQFFEIPDAPLPPDWPGLYQLDKLRDLQLDLPDFNFDHFEYHDLSDEAWKNMREDALRDLALQQEQLQKELKAQDKAWKKNQKEWSQAQKEQRKALEEAQRSLEAARKARHEAMEKARRELRSSQDAYRQAYENQLRAYRERHSAESVSQSLKNQLLEDRLISDPDNYSFELTSKSMKVNGKKQPDAVHQKYLDIYREKTGKDLGKGNFRIEVEN